MSVQQVIDSHIIGLACELRNMVNDICQSATYDGSDESSTESQYRKSMKKAVQYSAGAHLCEKFLYGSITLDDFCAEMVEEDLKEFLFHIPQLPMDLTIKYNLWDDVDAGDNANIDDVNMDCVMIQVDMPAEDKEK